VDERRTNVDAASDVVPEERASRPKVGEERFQRLLEDAKKLPLKLRLRLLDALKADATAEREDGTRFSLRSVSEFKRFAKVKSADQPLVDWIGGFNETDVFYDIGANTGSLSLLAARIHQGRVPVYAFEPAFENYEALVRNVLVNECSAIITPLQVALFDETGIRPFFYHGFGAGSALHAVGEALDYARRPFAPVATQAVMAFRLDDLVRIFALPRPTRIKLDVDGFENKVLDGASDVLSSARCDVYVELVEIEPGDPHPQRVTEFLLGLGYEHVTTVERRPPGTYPRGLDALFVRKA
jgi:FkbM family methyltransferase